MIHENFYYGDQFYQSIEDLMIDLEIDEETIEDQPDFFRCTKAQLEPLVKLSADWIFDRIDSDRFSEEGKEYDQVMAALNLIDFEKVNKTIPEMWYEGYEKFEITKADLYESL